MKWLRAVINPPGASHKWTLYSLPLSIAFRGISSKLFNISYNFNQAVVNSSGCPIVLTLDKILPPGFVCLVFLCQSAKLKLSSLSLTKFSDFFKYKKSGSWKKTIII